MYDKVSTNLNFVEREKQTEQFWRENRIFEKSMKNREGCPTYTFSGLRQLNKRKIAPGRIRPGFFCQIFLNFVLHVLHVHDIMFLR